MSAGRRAVAVGGVCLGVLALTVGTGYLWVEARIAALERRVAPEHAGPTSEDLRENAADVGVRLLVRDLESYAKADLRSLRVALWSAFDSVGTHDSLLLETQLATAEFLARRLAQVEPGSDPAARRELADTIEYLERIAPSSTAILALAREERLLFLRRYARGETDRLILEGVWARLPRRLVVAIWWPGVDRTFRRCIEACAAPLPEREARVRAAEAEVGGGNPLLEHAVILAGRTVNFEARVAESLAKARARLGGGEK